MLKIRIIYKLIHFKNRNNQMFTFSFFKNVLSLLLLFFYLKFLNEN
ncbi:conserved domain protein [Acinetobacter baumannii 6013113]|nr:conserved domain protein [Acinetobacter baumannii 6013113]